MATALHRFSSGLRYVVDGIGLIFRPGARRFVAVPLLVNTLLFSGALWFGYRTLGAMLDRFATWLPSWLDWIVTVIWPLVVLMVIIAIYYTFTLVANFIAAPFNSLLAEKIETILRGSNTTPGFGFRKLPEIAGRTIWSETRKLLYQLKWLILLLIISLVPGLNVLAPFAWFYFGAWMLSVNYVDYPMGNHDLYFSEVKRKLKSNRATALGLGSGLMLLTLVPGLNFIAMPVGVAAGTRFWVENSP